MDITKLFDVKVLATNMHHHDNKLSHLPLAS